MKIRPVRAELCYADGRADMSKLIVAYRNFANAPECTSGIMHESQLLRFQMTLRPSGKLLSGEALPHFGRCMTY